jgi:hypothetical protein
MITEKTVFLWWNEDYWQVYILVMNGCKA